MSEDLKTEEAVIRRKAEETEVLLQLVIF